MKRDAPTNPPERADPAGEAPRPEVIGGRYHVLATLNRGRDAETLLCSDPTRGTQVVIKRVAAASFSATARMRLEHEAHALTRIKTGRLAPLLDFGFTVNVR